MNKLEVSIELSFDIDAGTIEPFDDVKLNTNQLIHPEVFFERYQNYKMDLKDKAYIDTTAQQVLKIAESVIKNVIKENDGCICDANTNYGTDVDRVNIADVVYPGYEFWFDECGDIYASCTSLISADVFAAASANVDDFKLYKVLDDAMSRALKDAGLRGKIMWFDFSDFSFRVDGYE